MGGHKAGASASMATRGSEPREERMERWSWPVAGSSVGAAYAWLVALRGHGLQSPVMVPGDTCRACPPYSAQLCWATTQRGQLQ